LKGTTYKFTKEDIKYCIRKGSERYFKDKKKGFPEERYAKKRSGLELDVFGICGEYGMAAMMGTLQEHKSRLDDTTPQGIMQDRGDLVIDDQIIDTKCCIGNHNNIWVRKKSLRNPSDVYALFTYNRVNPLPEPEVYDDSFCTLHEDEDLVLHFQGAYAGCDLFVEENVCLIWGDYKYVAKQEELINLEDAIAISKALTPEQKAHLRRFNTGFF
jgi:hypothetical protein